MPHAPWPARLTHAIAGEIRRRRAARGMSAQQLSDRCAQLGLEIPRATLADLENGRRATLTAAELLIIARALEVSPLLLIAPAGTQDLVEISPGQRLKSWEAVGWLAGLRRLSETPGGVEIAPGDEDDVVPMFLLHEELMAESQSHEGVVGRDGEVVWELARSARRHLRRHRARMRKAGLTPPDLPPDLAYIDGKETGTDESV